MNVMNKRSLEYFITSKDFEEVIVDAIVESKKKVLRWMINNPNPENNKIMYTKNDMILENIRFLDSYINTLFWQATMKINEIPDDKNSTEKERMLKNIELFKKKITDFI